MALSNLRKIAEAEKKKQLAANKLNEKKIYSANHPDALSDGDEMGKGELKGQTGSKTDNIQKKKQMGQNKYGPNNAYTGNDIAS